MEQVIVITPQRNQLVSAWGAQRKCWNSSGSALNHFYRSSAERGLREIINHCHSSAGASGLSPGEGVGVFRMGKAIWHKKQLFASYTVLGKSSGSGFAASPLLDGGRWVCKIGWHGQREVHCFCCQSTWTLIASPVLSQLYLCAHSNTCVPIASLVCP